MKLRGTTHVVMIGGTTLLLCAGLAIPAAQAASTKTMTTDHERDVAAFKKAASSHPMPT